MIKVITFSYNFIFRMNDFKLIHPPSMIGEPEEIGSTSTFLTLDEGAFVIGADFRIDGGFHSGF